MNFGEFGNFENWSPEEHALNKMIYDEVHKNDNSSGGGGGGGGGNSSNPGCAAIFAVVFFIIFALVTGKF